MDKAILWIFLLGLLVLMAFLCVKIQKDRNKKRAVIDKYDPIYHAMLKHTDGLPIAQGAETNTFYCEDKFVFVRDNKEVSVAMDKVLSVDWVTGKNLSSQQVTGAAAGALVFGGISGAVLGSLIATTYYLVITYKSNNEVKHIVMDCYLSGSFGSKVQKHFKENNCREEEKIEL